ncbi:unnamed protein product [Caenorhabditis bovis]|uniref:Glucosamine 6-phosphate N-acetyltransferase n=1 Tax=Caenorhabditis bovis TaxID=2654633 RepID=A0A8S1FBU9_9PELO|nr:unnamed protein product [Caenorhabditis bovis]
MLSSTALFDEILLPKGIADVPLGLKIRPLEVDDYEKGYLELLEQLTTVGKISKDKFMKRFESMQKANSYYIVVIEDIELSQIIATATLLIEFKFIHGAGTRGRIEDVVVDQKMRGQKLGALLNKVLVDIAEKLGVYKLSLECIDGLIPFYEQFGYKKDVNFLVQRFEN